jgi:cytochrome oxidase Cu insertion factor (SCO1/SenC/PrrC family)
VTLVARPPGLAAASWATSLLLAVLCTPAPGDAILPPDPGVALGQTVTFDGFVDQSGQPFRAAADDGRAWIVSPIYTRCPTTCSALTAALQAALRQSGLRSADYRVVSLSFDPEETDASLAEFRDRLRLPPEWITLRAADRAALERTLGTLDFRTMQLDGGAIEHPNLVAVLDGGRRVVAFVYGIPLSAAELTRAVTRARAGASPLDGWRPYAFLFAALGFIASAAVFIALLSRARRWSAAPPHALQPVGSERDAH